MKRRIGGTCLGKGVADALTDCLIVGMAKSAGVGFCFT